MNEWLLLRELLCESSGSFKEQRAYKCKINRCNNKTAKIGVLCAVWLEWMLTGKGHFSVNAQPPIFTPSHVFRCWTESWFIANVLISFNDFQSWFKFFEHICCMVLSPTITYCKWTYCDFCLMCLLLSTDFFTCLNQHWVLHNQRHHFQRAFCLTGKHSYSFNSAGILAKSPPFWQDP